MHWSSHSAQRGASLLADAVIHPAGLALNLLSVQVLTAAHCWCGAALERMVQPAVLSLKLSRAQV